MNNRSNTSDGEVKKPFRIDQDRIIPVSYDQLVIDPLVKTVFNESKFPHVIEIYRGYGLQPPIYVIPLREERGVAFYKVVATLQNLEVRRASGEEEFEVTVLDLKEEQGMQILFTENLAEVLLANYRTKYELIVFLESYFERNRHDCLGVLSLRNNGR